VPLVILRRVLLNPGAALQASRAKQKVIKFRTKVASHKVQGSSYKIAQQTKFHPKKSLRTAAQSS
jgi:hypothetical protein